MVLVKAIVYNTPNSLKGIEPADPENYSVV